MSSGHHETFQRDDEIKGSSDRSFGIVFTAVFTIIGLWPLIGGAQPRWWSLAVAAAFAAVAALRPALLRPLNRLWFRFGLLLHKVVNPIVMGVMFYVVVTPIGIVMRWSGRQPLQLRLEPEAQSYWIRRDPPGPAPETMRNQF